MKLVSSNRTNRRSNNPPPESTTQDANTVPGTHPSAGYSTAPNRPAVSGGNAASNRPPAPRGGAAPNGRPAPGGNPQQSRNNAPYNAATNRNRAQPVSKGKEKSGTAKPVAGRKSPIKAVLITLMIIIVLAAGSFVALGFYVDSLDTIFPNVWADGINVSGMTLHEATAHMIYLGYENNVEGISATVIFPDDTSFSVSGEEVGLSFDAAEAAAIAFAFGRDETFFKNEMTYIRALFERTDLKDLSAPVIDDSIIHQLAKEYTEQFNRTLIESSLDRNESYITVTRGTGIHPAVEGGVVALALETLNRAILEHDSLSARYTPDTNASESVDFQILELQMIYDEIHREPVSAQVTYINDEVVITESSYGLTFDFELAVGNLLEAPIGFPVTIPMIELPPEYTKEEVQGWIFRDVLGSSRTREQSGNANRLGNLQVAAAFIDGTVLNPGEEFSFNEVVGPRRADRGFREANVIEGGVFVPGMGGGICQVSSTIHDAVMHTTLPVTQRRSHGLAIRYMPKADEGLLTLPDSIADESHSINRFIDGRRIASDAMVSWGTSDYRFINNTDFPVKIEATVSGRYLEITLHGTNLEGTYIKIETVVLSVTPFGNAEEPDETIPVGETRPKQGASGQPGLSAEIYQLLFSSDGELISRTLFEWKDDGNTRRISRYSAQPRTTLVGTMEAPALTGGGEFGGVTPGGTPPGVNPPVVETPDGGDEADG